MQGRLLRGTRCKPMYCLEGPGSGLLIVGSTLSAQPAPGPLLSSSGSHLKGALQRAMDACTASFTTRLPCSLDPLPRSVTMASRTGMAAARAREREREATAGDVMSSNKDMQGAGRKLQRKRG